MIEDPAILGGAPEFEEVVPLVRPTLAPSGEVAGRFLAVLESGMLTNSEHVARFEDECAHYLGVKHTVAVSSCTIGLMLVLRSLELSGEVLVPSFTFSATGHAIAWNGLTPSFVDCEPDTFTVSAADLRARMASRPARPAAIVAVHLFGNPVSPEIERVAAEAGVPLVFDAAHGFGARYPDGRRVGAGGTAEVFSLSPTKVLVTGEGGLVATNDSDLAARVRLTRNYGNTPSYETPIIGVNGRMPEVAALLGLANLAHLEEFLTARAELVELYMQELADLPGLRLQRVLPGARSVYKDFGLYVDEAAFGLSRDELAAYLSAENITTRKYFYPPLHRLAVYAGLPSADPALLPVTEDVSHHVLCLPLYSHQVPEQVRRIAACVRTAHDRVPQVRTHLRCIQEAREA